MKATSENADDTPLAQPFSEHWHRVYHRLSVIHHPLEAPDGRDVGHAEIAAEVGTPLSEKSETALMAASYGMSANARSADVRPRVDNGLISSIRLAVEKQALDRSADDGLSRSPQQAAAENFETLGVDHAETSSFHRSDHVDVSLDALAKGEAKSPVASRGEVTSAVRPVDRFEGFDVDARTTPGWPNGPATYRLPQGWLI